MASNLPYGKLTQLPIWILKQIKMPIRYIELEANTVYHICICIGKRRATRSVENLGGVWVWREFSPIIGASRRCIFSRWLSISIRAVYLGQSSKLLRAKSKWLKLISRSTLFLILIFLPRSTNVLIQADSEKRNHDFGDMDSAFPRLMFFGEIPNSARRGFGGMRAGVFLISNVLKIC